jgi:hypothetical protein
MAYEVWKGPSLQDGSTEIVVLITGGSENGKTGGQLQTWIMRTDMPPGEVIKADADEPICGQCVHRLNRSCYVLFWMGPRQAYDDWLTNPRPMPPNYTLYASIRYGAYGDWAFVPYEVAEDLMAHGACGNTGFTAQWRTCDQRYKNLLMASVSSKAEAREAQAMGWRTYRTAHNDWDLTKGEVLCPGSKEAGHKLTCFQCGACNGHATKLRGNVVVPVHGAKYLQNRFERGTAFQQPHIPAETMEHQQGVITWL